MVFRDISPYLSLSLLSLLILVGTGIAALIITSFLIHIVLKILWREDIFLRIRPLSFLQVLDLRILIWFFYGFVTFLDVSLFHLAWMYVIVILVTLLAYEFIFDLGALKTSIVFVIDFVLTLISFVLLFFLFH